MPYREGKFRDMGQYQKEAHWALMEGAEMEDTQVPMPPGFISGYAPGTLIAASGILIISFYGTPSTSSSLS